MTSISHQLATLVRSAKRKSSRARLIGLHTELTAELPHSIEVEGVEWSVHRVLSSMQARRVLVGLEADQCALLVTPLRESELGLEVVAELATRKLQELHPWQLVREAFRARRLDPRVLKAGAWMARALLESVPARGYPPVSSGLLDLGTVWSVLHPALGLRGKSPSVGDYLEASADGELSRRWAVADERLRTAAGKRLIASRRHVGQQLVSALDRGYGELLIPLGLVLGIVTHETVRTAATGLAARARLELYGVQSDEPTLLEPWSKAASEWVRRAMRAGGERRKLTAQVLKRAEQLLCDVRAEDVAYLSDVLPSGFDARADRLAEILSTVNASDGVAAEDLEQRLVELKSHALVASQQNLQDRVQRARDAVRLARWLASKPQKPTSLAEHASRYRIEGAFVDRARASIGRGEPEGQLKSVYGSLLEAIQVRREDENRAFGESLKRASAGAEGMGDLIPIEIAVEAVVVPLAQQTSVLLVVMDGMSEWVCAEIVADVISRSGYQRMSPSEQDRIPPMIGLLPSVTEVCRTSLLCGRSTTGGQSEERKGFRALAERFNWSGATDQHQLLFHKNSLSGAGGGLSPKALAAIESDAQVVACVINAVDDSLGGGEQVKIRWTLESIPILSELVQAAERQGRSIVLTSDHGHMVDHRSTQRLTSDGSAGRWRPKSGALDDLELEVSGSRVMLPEPGGPCIVPWSERARYSHPHAGYHGGASPQEVVTPLVVLVPECSLEKLDRWSAEVDTKPSWWEAEIQQVAVEVPRPAKDLARPKRTRSKEVSPTPSLFPEPSAEPVHSTPVAEESWTNRLFATAMWADQRKLAGRKPPSNQDVERVLLALQEAGGKLSVEALRNGTRLPIPRLRGLLTAMGRILNVDGYGVLVVDFGDNEILFDRELLVTQFSLQTEELS